MPNRDRARQCFAIVVLMLLTGCASSHAPKDWAGEPDAPGWDGFGCWIEVSVTSTVVAGEFIALGADSLYLAGPDLRAVARADITRARLERYNAKSLAGTVVGGTILSFSNGLLAAITFPLWLIGGSLSAAGRSREPYLTFPGDGLDTLRPYARYPQGLPRGVERSKIVMKPAPNR